MVKAHIETVISRPGVGTPEYVCTCGHCGTPLLRLASFRTSHRDYITCHAGCGAQNVVELPAIQRRVA